MKTNWRMPRLRAMMMAGVPALLLAACGQPSTGANKEAERETIKVGVILPLTGPAASAGSDSRNGLLVAQEEINSDTSGRSPLIELDIQDSKAQAKDGVSAAQQMIALHHPDVIYAQLSNVAMAIKPITESAGIPLIGISGAEALLDSSKLVLRNYPNPKYFASTALELIHQDLGLAELSIAYANSEFATSVKNAFTEASAAHGIAIPFSIPYDPASTDQATVALKIRASGAKAVYVIGFGPSLGTVIRKLREGGFTGAIIGGIELPYPEVLDLIAKTDTNIYYVDFHWPPTTASEGTFTERYHAKFNSAPNSSSYMAYAALRLVVGSQQGTGNNIDLFNPKSNGEHPWGITVKDHEVVYPLQLKRLYTN